MASAATVTAEGPQPVPAGAPPAPGIESNENAARAYEVGREISVTHSPQGRLRRVSVAVALNQGKKALTQARSEESRVGKECVITVRSRMSTEQEKKKKKRAQKN